MYAFSDPTADAAIGKADRARKKKFVDDQPTLSEFALANHHVLRVLQASSPDDVISRTTGGLMAFAEKDATRERNGNYPNHEREVRKFISEITPVFGNNELFVKARLFSWFQTTRDDMRKMKNPLIKPLGFRISTRPLTKLTTNAPATAITKIFLY